MKNFFLLKGKRTILREKSKRMQDGQGAEDVEKLHFKMYGITKNPKLRERAQQAAAAHEKKNFSPIQRVFHKKCEKALERFCYSTTNFAFFGELPLKRNKYGK
jgi:hypothetical protein